MLFIRRRNDIDCDSETFNSTDIDGLQYLNINAKSLNFTYVVCTAEINTQKLVTISNGIRGPIGKQDSGHLYL